MISRSELNGLSGEVNAISKATQSVISECVSSLMAEYADEDGTVSPERIAELREALIEELSPVLSRAADLSAARTAEFYDVARAEAQAKGAYSALAISGREQQATQGAIRAFMGLAERGETDSFLNALLWRTDYEVRKASGECIRLNCEKDPAKLRWARVPSGLETCGFCLMLASRGFDYLSYKTAGGAGNHYHANCDCRIVPGYDGITEVEGYNPGAMYKSYLKCREALGDYIGMRDAYNALSSDERSRYDDFSDYMAKSISREIETRDAEWYQSGEAPEVSFADNALENTIRSQRPREIETAKLLSPLGINCDFVYDELIITDETTGQKRKVGLADFANGYEIKTLISASSYNTIDGYIKNTSRKKNATALYFDNTANGALTDESLAEMIRRSRRFKRGRIYILTKEKELLRIR